MGLFVSGCIRRGLSVNPHKYLLYKPSPIQLVVYLSSGCNDIPPSGAILLYVSGDAQVPMPSQRTEDGDFFVIII